jgi:diguanylate cyclase (GGDEF)-like protein
MVAERLRGAIAGHPLECVDSAEAVTCSFGIAELAAGDESGMDLYHRADLALYRSKQAGRNRVEVSSE